jgi:hypothetical protein
MRVDTAGRQVRPVQQKGVSQEQIQLDEGLWLQWPFFFLVPPDLGEVVFNVREMILGGSQTVLLGRPKYFEKRLPLWQQGAIATPRQLIGTLSVEAAEGARGREILRAHANPRLRC